MMVYNLAAAYAETTRIYSKEFKSNFNQWQLGIAKSRGESEAHVIYRVVMKRAATADRLNELRDSGMTNLSFEELTLNLAFASDFIAALGEQKYLQMIIQADATLSGRTWKQSRDRMLSIFETMSKVSLETEHA